MNVREWANGTAKGLVVEVDAAMMSPEFRLCLKGGSANPTNSIPLLFVYKRHVGDEIMLHSKCLSTDLADVLLNRLMHCLEMSLQFVLTSKLHVTNMAFGFFFHLGRFFKSLGSVNRETEKR